MSSDHLTGLSHQSQNKTATLFTQLYRGHATRTVQPLAALYDDIRIVLRSNEADISTENLGAGPPKDLAASAKKFFREIFPVAYHNVLKLDSKQFSPEYEVCLKYAYDAVQPFGDVPQQVNNTHQFFLLILHSSPRISYFAHMNAEKYEREIQRFLTIERATVGNIKI